MRTSGLPWACIAAWLCGCTVGPDFRPPPAPHAAYAPPPAAIAAQGMKYGGDVEAEWYSLFHSAALDHLVREALRSNPGLDGARHSLRAAQYELAAVAGTALPQVTLAAKASRSRVNGSLLYEPDEALQVTANQYTLGPSLAYDLDVFGRLRRTIESQAARTSSVQRQVLDVYVTLVDQVVVTAFGYAAQSEQLEVTRRLVQDLESQYELTRTLENAGKLIRSDTLQAQAQLENTRATLPAIEKQRDMLRDALIRLTGVAPQQADVPLISLKDFTLPQTLPVSLPARLVRQRPDILEAEDLLHAASANIGIAEAARLPDFNLTAQFAQQSIRTSDLFTYPASIWSAGIDMTAPLFTGGTLRSREQEARERFAQAQAQYRSTVIGAFVEVTDALHALQHDADGYSAHIAALEAARANRDLARDQFQHGAVNELVVLNAEQQYQSAALAAVQADAQRFTDAAELFRALGGGWWNAPDPTRATP
ncbi:MAG TPA: efflux transporter outer membrane subunit [Steroidobacteraceae bacterium]|nr:efflux transporter outer membrane subunit [Steroidobacteraceae bacterium]